MNAFFKVKGLDDKEYRGIVFGADESELMRKIIECYEPSEVTFQFGECFDGDIIELADLQASSLIDF